MNYLRIRAYYLLLLVMLISLSGLAQQDILVERVTIRFKGESVREALELLMKETSYDINYSLSDAPQNRTIKKNFQQERLETVLKEIWGDDQLIIRFMGNSINLKSSSIPKRNTKPGNLTGQITDENGEPQIGATVRLTDAEFGSVTDLNGRYRINAIPSQTYQLQVSSVGFEKWTKQIEVIAEKTTNVNATLKVAVGQLEEVVVEARSIAQLKAREPIAISTVNAVKLQSQTQDVAKVLDKVEGVRIRQSGGLGSQTAISINGLTGNSIRFYYNGIPTEFLGGGFQLNTLPISNVDRIEVYKGVMPASIGTDALGGGINITTNQDSYDNLDLSYQYGSFNTHRVAGSITRSLNDKWVVNVNANYNYSDNNYEMNVQNNTYDPDLPFPIGIESIRIRRFHDAFSSFLGHTNLGYVNDQKRLFFNIGAYVTSRYKEIQHGARVGFVPIGQMDVRGQDSYLKLDLNKQFGQRWQLDYLGIGGYSRQIVTDSTRFIYDWNGENITLTNPAISRDNGAELFLVPSRSDIFNYNTVHRLGITRDFGYDISLSLHHFFAYQNRTGTEEEEINYIGGQDPNETGFSILRNITSLELKKYFFNSNEVMFLRML
ncbi:MAG: carboxypeptidase-like regulatory domain-containing protein, partial [Bacteroidota bacterium]